MKKDNLETELFQYFGFQHFLAGQKQAIEFILNGESSVAIFPTGAGKSLCYQFPALFLPGITLVVSPLLSLIKDQLDFLLSKNIPSAKLDSTQTKDEYNQVLNLAKNNKIKILMISVERFKNERFRMQLQNLPISLLVVDEAHCISEWGHNFRPEYLKIPKYQEEFKIKQVLLLTATATVDVCKDMIKKFNIPQKNVIVTGFYRKNLFLQITPVASNQKKQLLYQRLVNETVSTIIYVTQQKTAEEIAKFLVEQGLKALPYHAGLSAEDRENIQNRFMNNEIPIIVATIAFGMGIDKNNIRNIIHYDLPKSIENYSQEIGRAGRDGENAKCEVFANRDNVNILENFIYGDTPELTNIKKVLKMIKNQNEGNWEIKIVSLANLVDIRVLTLKTLLVYLEMENIIKPRYSYFEEYNLKYIIDQSEIINKFSHEKKEFVKAIFANCKTNKVWTSINISNIISFYNTNRDRILKALEYFEEKKWLVIEAKNTIEVFEILNNGFDLDYLSEKLYQVFKEKEQHEIARIKEMLSFFESKTCLNQKLSAYFGEKIETKCGHCSPCNQEIAQLVKSEEKKDLSSFDFSVLIKEIKAIIPQEQLTPILITKYLCGINSPIFTKNKLTKTGNFGILMNYPFQKVLSLGERQV